MKLTLQIPFRFSWKGRVQNRMTQSRGPAPNFFFCYLTFYFLLCLSSFSLSFPLFPSLSLSFPLFLSKVYGHVNHQRHSIPFLDFLLYFLPFIYTWIETSLFRFFFSCPAWVFFFFFSRFLYSFSSLFSDSSLPRSTAVLPSCFGLLGSGFWYHDPPISISEEICKISFLIEFCFYSFFGVHSFQMSWSSCDFTSRSIHLWPAWESSMESSLLDFLDV